MYEISQGRQPYQQGTKLFNDTFKVFRSRVVSARFPSSWKTEGGASSKPFDAMPGSKPLPFIGNSWEVNNNLKGSAIIIEIL